MLTLGNKLTLNSQPIYKFVNKYSIDFDGVDDRIVTDGADTVIQNTTYSFWCKSSTTSENKGVFGHGGTDIGSFHFNYSSNRPMLYWSTNDYIFWNDNPAQDDGEWHHWVVYADTTNITNCKLYCDGVLQTVNTTFNTAVTPHTESLTIGSDRQVGGHSFEGKIDEFAVYDRELTQAEITRMYNTYYSPNRVANGNFSQIGNEEVTNGDFSQIGSEKVTNGNFATDSNWSKSGQVTISGGVAYFDSDGTFTQIAQTLSGISGKNAKVVVEITEYNQGTLKVLFSGGTQQNLPTSVGVHTLYFSNVSSNTINIARVGGVTNIKIDNVSVKEVGQDWTFGDGWGMGDGIATCDGTQSSASYLLQNLVLPTPNQYLVTFEVSNYASGNVKFGFSSSTTSPFGTARTANGVYTETFTHDSNTIALRFRASDDFVGDIDNISVKEVGQHWNFGTGWSMGDGVAISTTDVSNLVSTATLIVGRTYKFQIDAAKISSGSYAFLLRFNTTNTNIGTVNADGSYEFNVVADSTSFRLQTLSGGTTSFSVDNIVVQELKHDATNLMLNAGDYQSANPLITSTKSMEFDGSDDYMVANSTLGSFTGSFSFWVNRDNNTGYQFLYDARGTGGTGTGYAYASIGIDVISVSSGTVYVDGVATTTVPTDGNWHNVVITGITLDVTEDIKFASSNVVTNLLNGKMTEVGLWNRTLTSLEVASLYNQGMPTNLLVNRNNYQSGNPTVFNTKQVDFDGVDDKLVFNTPSAFSGLGLNSFDCTLSAWAKFDTIGQFEALVSLGTYDLEIAPLTATDVGIWVDNAGLSTTYTPTMGEWNHYVATKSGNTYSLYVDGVLIGSDTDSDNATIGTQSFIGSNGAGNYFDGDISQVGVWNEALTADEVSSLYNHGLPIDLTTDQAAYASSSNLVGYWRMGSGTLDSYPLIADQTNATLGVELSPNTDFTSNITGWSSYDSGTASWDSFNGGSMKLVNNGTNNWFGRSTNNFTLETDSTYIVTAKVFIASGYTGGDFYIYAASTFSGMTDFVVKADKDITGQWQDIKYTFVTASDASGRLYFRNDSPTSSSGATVYVDDVSVKKVQGNPAYMTNMFSSDIENGSPYANIVQNGTFDTDSDWTKGTGWTISDGKAHADTSGTAALSQTISTGAGNTYEVTFTISNFTTGVLQPQFDGILATPTQINSNGTHTVKITAAGSSHGLLLYAIGTSEFSIDNVTVEEVNTGLQGYWKMGDGTNDEYPVIYDQVDPTLSDEKVVDGNFPTPNNNWNLTFFTIANNKLHCISDGTYSNAYQSNVFTVGKTYKITFDITGHTLGEIRVRPSAQSPFFTANANGSYTFYYTATNSQIAIERNNAACNMFLENLSVKEVQGNSAYMTNMVEGNITNQYPLTKIRNYYRMGDGILDGYPIIQDQTSPNLAHIPTTNLETKSNTFSTWTSLVNVTATANYIVSPDGTQNATRLQFTGGGYLYNTAQGINNKEFTISCYAKRNDSGTQSVGFFVNGSGTVDSAWSLTSDWVRFTYTYTSTNTSMIGIAGNSGADVSVFGFQIEHQSQATAYIKSDGIAAVRKSSTTNLISYSEDFSQASQVQNITLTANAITSPTGTSNGTKVLSSDNNSKVSYTNISFTNGTTYTLSVYCRNINATALKFFIYNSGGGDITDDFTSQVNTTSWTRVSTTFTASQDTSSGQVQFARNLPSGESAYFWGFQLEEQTQAETYAKTTGLPVEIDLFTENNYGTMTNMSASDIVEDTP